MPYVCFHYNIRRYNASFENTNHRKKSHRHMPDGITLIRSHNTKRFAKMMKID